jgi:hypothetical protein
MSKEPKPLTVRIDGGDNQLRTLLGDFFEAALVENGFHDVRLYHPNARKAENYATDAETIYDLIDKTRPELFETKIAILALPDERELIIDQDDLATADFKRTFIRSDIPTISRVEQMARNGDDYPINSSDIAVEIPTDNDPNSDGSAP